MEVKPVPHMNGGLGKTSYAENSSLQKAVISKVKSTLQKSVIDVYCSISPECFRIADLGCSSGPNALIVTSEILDAVDATCRCLNKKLPHFQVFLNDLPENDFNTIFQSLPSFYERLKKEKGAKFGPCFITGMPGNFYGRLFPTNSMHIVHSSYSLHWLSQVPKGLVSKTGEPLNKGTIYLTETSPPMVFKSYLNQFKEDFTLFLRSRSEEIVPGGSMILTFIGRTDHDPKSLFEVLGRAINDMVLEDLIEETELDHLNVPFYAPNAREVEKVIEEEGSFSLQKLYTFEIGWDAGFNEPAKDADNNHAYKDYYEHDKAQYISDYMRAVTEPMLVKQFGQTIMDDLYERFRKKITESLVKEKWQYVNLVISLTKSKLA